jgi:hypothetical protein
LALIPAYVLLAVGIMVGLIGTGVLDDLLIPSYVMFAIAIPFLVVYARNPNQLWPLIPGGILTVIGVSFLVAEVAFEYILPAVLLIAGIWIVASQLLCGEQADPAVTLPHADQPALAESDATATVRSPDADAAESR